MDEKIEDLLEKVEQKEKRRLKVISLVTTLAIILLVVVTIFISSDLNKVEEISKENTVLKDSTRLYEGKLDSLKEIKSILERAEKTVEEFYSLSSKGNTDSLKLLVADTLSRYYLEEDVPSTEVIDRIERHLNRYPNEVFYIKDALKSIYQEDNESVVVYALLGYSRYGNDEKEIISEFRINRFGEIFYIRNYESSHSVFAEYKNSANNG